MWVPAQGPVPELAVPLEEQQQEAEVEPPEQPEVVPLRCSGMTTGKVGGNLSGGEPDEPSW